MHTHSFAKRNKGGFKERKIMIKVIHVISDTNIGGAGTVLLTILRNIDRSRFDVKVVLPDNITAPVYAGDNVGKITIYLGSQILMEGDLTATRTVLDHLEVPDDLALILIDIKKPGSFGNVLLIIAIVIVSIIALFSIFFVIKLYLYNRKKRKYHRSNIYTRRRNKHYGSQY